MFHLPSQYHSVQKSKDGPRKISSKQAAIRSFCLVALSSLIAHLTCHISPSSRLWMLWERWQKDSSVPNWVGTYVRGAVPRTFVTENIWSEGSSYESARSKQPSIVSHPLIVVSFYFLALKHFIDEVRHRIRRIVHVSQCQGESLWCQPMACCVFQLVPPLLHWFQAEGFLPWHYWQDTTTCLAECEAICATSNRTSRQGARRCGPRIIIPGRQLQHKRHDLPPEAPVNFLHIGFSLRERQTISRSWRW